MRFKAMIDELVDALLAFCREQDYRGERMDEELIHLAESAHFVFSTLPDDEMKEYAVYHYHFYSVDGNERELFPDHIKENGMLCQNAVHLMSVPIDSYTPDGDVKEISSCYDVVYDTEKKSIMLLYRLMIVDSEMTTIYRTESDEYEFFDSYQFMMELVAHLSAKLHRKASMKETSGVIHEEGTLCIA